MEYYFKITKEEYLQTMEAMLRDKRKRPVNLILFFLMTVCQLGFVIWHIATSGIDPAKAVALLVCSLVICGMQLYFQLGLRTRAKKQMERDMSRGSISEDFWKQQHLVLHDDLLRLKCGKSELRYDCAFFSKAQEMGNMLLLSFTRRKEVHQLMVPLSAFKGEGSAEFIEALEASKKSSISAGLKENRVQRPEDCEFSVEYSYKLKSFCRDQVRAARLAYAGRVAWNVSTLARLAGSLYIMRLVVSGSFSSVGWAVVAVCVVILLVYPVLLVFTPVCALIIRRNIGALFGGLDTINCSLDIAENKLWHIGDSFDNVIDLSRIIAVVKAKDLTVLYFKGNIAITVPLNTADNPKLQRMVVYLEALADINWRNRSIIERLH